MIDDFASGHAPGRPGRERLAPDNAERDCYLGTHDEEVERLGLQHRVWRPMEIEAWRRAGITVASRVLDVGAGPGGTSTCSCS